MAESARGQASEATPRDAGVVRHGQRYRSRSRSRSHDPSRERELLHPRHHDKARRRPGSGTSAFASASTEASHPPLTLPTDNTTSSPPSNNRSRRSRRDRSASRVRADRDLRDHGSPAPAPTNSERHSPHNSHHHHSHRTSHHHHHRHHRSRSRSRSPSRHHRSHLSRHHNRSPASSSGISHRNTDHSRARSPRPAQPPQASLAERHSRRPPPEERSHWRDEDTAYRNNSPRSGHRKGTLSGREREEESGHRQRHRQQQRTSTKYRESSSYRASLSANDRRLPRSPTREVRSRSKDSLGRTVRRDDRSRSASRSVSRERERGRRTEDTNSGKESEMYPRGGRGGHGHHQGYGQGYGYGHGPPQHNNRQGYNSQPPYPPHAGPPQMHGYPQHQPHHAYHNGPQQPHVPQYHPQPGLTYGNSPNRVPYPPRDVPGPGRDGPPPRGGMRGGPPGRGGRGTYANMSWTPQEGTKGGHLMQPGEKLRGAKEDLPPTTPQSRAQVNAGSPEDEDNPFRPPVDLRTEDEELAKQRKATSPPPRDDPKENITSKDNITSNTTQESEVPKAKISFSIKGRATQAHAHPTTERSAPLKPETSPLLERKVPVLDSPLAPTPPPVPKSRLYVGNQRVEAAPKPSPPLTRKEIVRKKRIKVKPQLSEEHSKSESVYYRKPGNESVVGSGTYGKVYKTHHIYTGNWVALKKIRMEGERDGFPVTAIREIKLLQSLKHVNIVALREVMVEKNDCFMVFEYLEHDLTGLINHTEFTLTPAHKKHFAKQFFEGLEHLHRRGVLHRDIKAANILISKNGDLKLADFGLARFFERRKTQDYTNRVVTIWYRSPELLLGETQYGPAIDIWSAACVLIELFTRSAIFPGDGSEINQLDKIYSVLGTPSRGEWPGISELQWYQLLRPTVRQPSIFVEKYSKLVSPEAFELLQMMFAYDPTSRPTATDILAHPYFTSEEPAPERPVELALIDGDWHEYESKALRKEKEKAERDARRRERDLEKEKQKAEKEGEKRKADGEAGGAEAKRVKTDPAAPA